MKRKLLKLTVIPKDYLKPLLISEKKLAGQLMENSLVHGEHRLLIE